MLMISYEVKSESETIILSSSAEKILGEANMKLKKNKNKCTDLKKVKETLDKL